jgi:hypothetical protein
MKRFSLKNISIVSLVLFLFSGFFETFPIFSGFPLKFLFLIIPSLYIALYVLSNFTFPRTLFLTIPFLIALLPSYITLTNYSTEKTFTFVTVFLISSIYGSFLIRQKSDLKVFLYSFSAVGFIICLVSLPSLSTLDTFVRLNVYGINPIWLSRAVSFSLVFFVILYIHKKMKLFWMLLFNSLILLVMIGSGSKAPILAVVISLGLLYIKDVFKVFLKIKNIFISLVLVLFAVISSSIIVKIVPDETIYRFTSFVNGEATDSAREDLYKISLNLIPYHPLGIGLGNFKQYSYLEYPHNIILESFVEGGWLFGIYLVFLIAFNFFILRRLSRTKDYLYQALYALFIMSFINSMFSGNLTSPKELYLIFAISFAFYIKEFKVYKERMKLKGVAL